MKKTITKQTFYLIFVLAFISCENKTTYNKETIQEKSEIKSDNNFIFNNLNNRIEMIFEDNAKYLEIGKPMKGRLVSKNINLHRLTIIGMGIKFDGVSNEIFYFTVTPIEKYLINGKLEIKINERANNSQNLTCTFLVPVR